MATAITYRHGTKEEHEKWTGGAPSELTVSTDELTVYVHSGEESEEGTGTVGIPLARADLDNVSLDTLKSKKVLDTDLSNFRNETYKPQQDGTNPALGAALSSYLDLKNNIGINFNSYASANLGNVTTTVPLATNFGSNNLLYANLSNLSNLNDLWNKGVLDKDLAKLSTTGENKIESLITSHNYATINDVADYVDNNIPDTSGFEKTINKTQHIDTFDTNNQNNIKYPTASAVIEYVNEGLNLKYVVRDLSNVTEWGAAFLSKDVIDIKAVCSTPGSNYAIGNVITTNISLPADEINSTTQNLKITVTDVDANGAIKDFELSTIFTQDKTKLDNSDPNNPDSPTIQVYTDPNKKAVFTISFTKSLGAPGNIAKKDLSNTDALTKTLAASTYLKKADATSTYATITNVNSHINNKSNPHEVTKAQVGLGNVDNTSDANKPISTATQTALNGKQATLVSGTNIKTINNTSLLGSGNIAVATTSQGSKADSAVQPGDNISTLTNDTGFITKSVNNLDNYTLSSSLSTVATSGAYSDLSGRPTIPTISDSYSATSSNGMSGKAVSSAITTYNNTIVDRNYVQGVAGNANVIPSKIAIYSTPAEALAASQADPTLLAFSLS